MKNSFLICLSAFFCTIFQLNAQTLATPLTVLPTQEEFVLKGTISNYPKDEKGRDFKLSICDILENQVHKIPILSDGTFIAKLPVREMQDIYLYTLNSITLTACPTIPREK